MKTTPDHFVDHLSTRTGKLSQETYASALIRVEDANDPTTRLVYRVDESLN